MADNSIRILIAKPGLDGHDRGARIITRSLRESGIDVVYTGIRQTPKSIVKTAVREKVDIIGISILSGAHMELIPMIIKTLDEWERNDILLIAGGIIPERDVITLKEMGVIEVFGPGTNTSEIEGAIRKIISTKTPVKPASPP